jgi:hypothetical protein
VARSNAPADRPYEKIESAKDFSNAGIKRKFGHPLHDRKHITIHWRKNKEYKVDIGGGNYKHVQLMKIYAKMRDDVEDIQFWVAFETIDSATREIVGELQGNNTLILRKNVLQADDPAIDVESDLLVILDGFVAPSP